MREYTTREIDQRFALLDQYECRCIIHFLQKTEAGHAPIDDVVNHLQKQNPTPDDRNRIVTALHHNHLPQLATIGVVDFDPRSKMVRYYGDELVEVLLKSTPETHIPGT